MRDFSSRRYTPRTNKPSLALVAASALSPGVRRQGTDGFQRPARRGKGEVGREAGAKGHLVLFSNIYLPRFAPPPTHRSTPLIARISRALNP